MFCLRSFLTKQIQINQFEKVFWEKHQRKEDAKAMRSENKNPAP